MGKKGKKGGGKGSAAKKGAAKTKRGAPKKGLQAKGGGKGGSRNGAEKEKKRKVEELSEEEPEGKKHLTFRQKKRKEVTSLYAELINPGRERKTEEIVADILVKLEERPSPLSEYCSKEIGSRVVQACLKWGSHKQRQQLLQSLKEKVPKLACDRYGHVVVQKLLRYCGHTSTDRKPSASEKKARSENMRDFLAGFSGRQLHAAFYHKHGCRVINSIYYSDVVSTKEKRRLLHEIAVPQAVALTRPELPGSRPLRHLMKAEDVTDVHRAQMVEHLREACEKSVDKELLGIDIVHLLFQAYCEFASEAQLKEMSEKCMAGAPYLLSSKPGAEALIRLLGVTSAKQRKALCKDLKGKFAALSMNAVDYVVMMRLASTIDDTVLLQKGMLAEMEKELEEICFDKYGHRVLAWLLRPDDSHLFSPYERDCLNLAAPSALKAADTRRQELVRHLRPALRQVLLAAPLKALDDINAKDLLVAYLATDWDAEFIEAILAAGEQEASDNKADFGLLGGGTATTGLITLLKLEKTGVDTPLAMPLWKRCLEPLLASAVTNRCAFVILALLKGGGAVRKAVLATLRKRKGEVEAAVKKAEAAGKVVKGAKILLTEIAQAKGE